MIVAWVALTGHAGMPPARGDTLTVTITGDILLDRGVRNIIRHYGTESLFTASTDSGLLSSDIVVGNLECPATTGRQPMFKRFVFPGEPEWLDVLRRHGYTHLNLANNHSIDLGRAGLTDTKANIERSGMTPIGAGNRMEEAAREVLLDSTPRRVYMLASLRLALENYVYLPDRPCVSQEPFDSLLCRIATLRQRDPHCYIIVSLHWGAEHVLTPYPRQRDEARRIIDAGADCMVCHHSHTLQTIETYRGRCIYYSIGNFIFDQQKPPNTNACMVRIKITETDAAVETIPVKIERCAPQVYESARRSCNNIENK